MLNQIKNVLIYTIFCTFLYNSTVYAVSTGSCFDTADTVLMLHMNGADTSTTFTDSDDGAKTVTTYGNAQIDTAQSKFGGASYLGDGSGDGLSIASHADLDFGTGDFTIDFWIRWNVFAQNTSFRMTDSNWLNWQTSGGGRIDLIIAGTSGVGTTFVVSTNTWYHIAVTRSGTSVRVFVDGDLKETITTSNSVSANTFFIAVYDGSIISTNGWYDEFRIVKGTAVWTANFTPPAAEYTDCAASSVSQSSTFIGVSGNLQSY